MTRLLVVALAAAGICFAQRTVHGIQATSGESFTTTEGVTVVIEGIQAPLGDDERTAASGGGERARAALEELVRGKTLTLEIERDRRLPTGSVLAHPKTEDGRLIAANLLAQGAVRLCLEPGAMRHADALRAAQSAAKAAEVGVWTPPTVPPATVEPAVWRGASLGMYSQSDDFDYGPLLDEIRHVGASHVALSSPRLMNDWRSNAFSPVEGRSASWRAIERATLAARARGLAVVYHPMILLRTGTIEHWRGDIDPTERWLWFRNYSRFIGRWADLARDLGVTMLVVGAEFASLEKETEAWRAIIANVRSRFAGKLTYSANWDHFEAVGFWNELDFVGMTGFFSLTKKNDPTVEELAAAWALVREKLLQFQAAAGKPLLITEIGYTSQDGVNRDPWDYFRYQWDLDAAGKLKPPDHREQADCFQALFQAWADCPAGYQGLFVWNWWRHEEPSRDYGFSIAGKPAYDVVKRGFSDLIRLEKEKPAKPK